MSIVHKPAEQDGFQLLWKCTFQSLFTAAAAPQGGRQYTHTQHQAQKHVINLNQPKMETRGENVCSGSLIPRSPVFIVGLQAKERGEAWEQG